MDVFDLSAIIRLDSSEYERGLSDAESRASSFGSKFKSSIGTAVKVGTAAIGAAATAVGVLTKAAVSGYAEQEQLVGGVKKLYGNMGMSVQEYAKNVGKSVNDVKGEWSKLEKAQNIVLKNADEAYKTSGMSANRYMETATSFSAALINSLNGDTVKAAKQTDVAMRAISDNFNTFGGDIGMIQYAFQGFAKQNYTMLDNLKLGYGGTKTEMERLIADANEYAKANGQAADLSIKSFSDIVTAIELIQEKQGIAGTTAREAASTISGSFGMLKGAWENLVAGFGDKNADLGKLIDNVVSSAEVVLKNAVPVVENALTSIASSVAKMGPVIGKKIPELIKGVVPDLVDAGMQLIQGLLTGILENAPALLEGIASIATTIASGIVEHIPELIDTIKANLPAVIETGKSLVQSLISGIEENGPSLLSKAATLVTNLIKGWVGALPSWWSTLASFFSRVASFISENAPAFIEKAGELVRSLAKGLIEHLPELLASGAELILALMDAVGTAAVALVATGFEIINNIALGIKDGIASVLGPIADSIKDRVMSAINSLKSALSSAWGVIRGAASSAWSGIRSVAGSIWNGIKSAVMRPVNALKGSLSGAWSTIKSKASSAWSAIKSAVTKPFETAKDKIQEVVNKIKSLFPISLGKIFKGIINLPKVFVKKNKDGGAEAQSKVNYTNFAKAMNQPYLFDKPTVFNADVAGEAGQEVLYGRKSLMDDIAEAVGGTTQQIVNNFYVTVDGAEDPEDWVHRMFAEFDLVTRTA